MRPPRLFLVFVVALLLVCGLPSSLAAQSPKPQHQASLPNPLPPQGYPLDWVQQSVPAQRSFWEDSYNWTTNYGPAFRDTVEVPTQLLGCSNQFALCFHSGAEPYPCTLSADGQSAICLCPVATPTNYDDLDLRVHGLAVLLQPSVLDRQGCAPVLLRVGLQIAGFVRDFRCQLS